MSGEWYGAFSTHVSPLLLNFRTCVWKHGEWQYGNGTWQYGNGTGTHLYVVRVEYHYSSLVAIGTAVV